MDDTVIICSRCGTRLDHVTLEGLCPRCVALDMFTPAPDSSPGIMAETEPSRFFGKYEILEEIARGGMGVVYRARQVELDRVVAVKTIAAGVLAGDDAITRFQREATAAASLNHPNIVAIHEVGRFQGHHYFAMEYVAGPTLATLVRDGPLPAKRAATYLRAVSEAVEYAHGRGVLHRDLKPSNILVDERDRPRVTDFGLAKQLNAPHDMTLSGQVLGTPAFTAPEQATRQSVGPGPWSDVYGLGAILYQLITGRPPFTGESPTEILAQVLDTDPIAPRLLHPALPRDLETICLKCLEKDPGRRYSSANDLALDLGRFLEDEPIRARPITPAERAWRWCKRRPSLAISLGVIALLLVGITVLSSRASHRLEVLRLNGLTNLYASDMRLAQQAIAESKFGAAAALLDRHRPLRGDPDLRGFEWRHFQELCKSEETVSLEAHTNQVQRAAFSSDGQLFATAATDIQIWDVETRKRIFQFPVGGFVWALAFSPDGRELLAGDSGGNVFRFDLSRRAPEPLVTRLENLPAPAIAFAWPAEDRSRVHFLARDRLLAWDGTNSRAEVVTQFAKGFARAQIAADGHVAALVSGPNRVSVWELSGPTVLHEFVLPVISRAIAISPKGTRLAVGDYSGALRTWSLEAGGSTNVSMAHRGLIECVAFSPDGRLIASGGADQIIRVHEAGAGKLVSERQGHRSTIMALVFSPDGRWLGSGDKLGRVKLWNMEGSGRASARGQLPASVLSKEGARVATSTSDTSIVVRSSSALREAGVPYVVPSGAWVLPSTNRLAVIDLEGRLHSLGTNQAWREHSLGGQRATRGGVLSPNGQFAALHLTTFQGPFVWDLDASREALRIPNEPQWLGGTFSADSHRFVYGLPTGHVHIWEFPSGREVNFFQAHKNNYAYASDLSADGMRLATAGFDGLVKLWDVDHALLLAEYRSTADAFWTVALAPDGRRVAAGTSESTIVLWDTTSRQEVATFQLGGPLAPVEGIVRFSPDGSTLLHANGVLHFWQAPKDSL